MDTNKTEKTRGTLSWILLGVEIAIDIAAVVIIIGIFTHSIVLFCQ